MAVVVAAAEVVEGVLLVGGMTGENGLMDGDGYRARAEGGLLGPFIEIVGYLCSVADVAVLCLPMSYRVGVGVVGCLDARYWYKTSEGTLRSEHQ
jgi:hypothetical protein